jgi:type II restriction enzyme
LEPWGNELNYLQLLSFIHSSLNTNFGTSIFEPVAKALASANFQLASLQQVAGLKFLLKLTSSSKTLMDNLTAATSTPNKPEEINAMLVMCPSSRFDGARRQGSTVPAVKVRRCPPSGLLL